MRKSAMRYLILLGAMALTIPAALAWADETPATPPAAGDDSALSPSGAKVVSVTTRTPAGKDKRLMFVIPNYRADQLTDNYKPLTTSEKFKIARSDAFDWPNFFMLAGFALQTQVATSGWHGKRFGAGFGKFYARSVGDQIIGSYMSEAIMPTLMHEDPRYFRMGTGSIPKRFLYSASRVVITRGQDGKAQFNRSEIFGNMAVIGATTAYYPAGRSASGFSERLALCLGNDVVSNLMTEFWPDVKRRIPKFRRKSSF